MLDRLVSVLPASWQPRAKGIVAALGTVLGLASLVVDGAPSWLTKAILVTTALGVYYTPAPGYRPAGGYWDGISYRKPTDEQGHGGGDTVGA
jgi:hypothetical protein